ncbi:MAG: single-stranded DNA-binding protein [Candidatus Nanopelagicales bacterium]
MSLPNIQLVGNLVDEPELRFTSGGKAVVSFRVACNDRKKVNGEWVDSDTTFLTVQAWEQLAENIAESLTKGQSVAVQGRLAQRSYEAKDGTTRQVFEIKADSVGPDLRRATANVTKASGGGSTTSTGRLTGDDPWATPPSAEAPF